MPVTDCDICGMYSDTYKQGPITCYSCPKSLNRDTLFASVNTTVEQMIDSAAYQQGGERGVVILQGPNVPTCAPLVERAGDLAFYLDEGSDLKAGIRRCKEWSLRARSPWRPGRDQSDDDYLDGFSSRDNSAFYRQYMHEEHYAPEQNRASGLCMAVSSCPNRRSLLSSFSI